MSHIVEIDTAQGVAEDTILAALRLEGVEGTVMDVAPHLRLRVPGADLSSAASSISRALDRVLFEQALPFVPDRVGTASFVLRPPAG